MKDIRVLLLLLLVLFWLFINLTPRNLPVNEYEGSKIFDLRQFDFVDRLKDAQIITMPSPGPEDIEIDSNGYIYTGLFQGSLYRIDSNTSKIQKISETYGRVLGLCLSPSEQKLAFVDLQGGIGILNLRSQQKKYYARHLKNRPINSLVFVSENVLYFTITGIIPMQTFHEELLYLTYKGSVSKLDLQNGHVQTLVSGLAFPNGIDYDPKSETLYVNELSNYRVIKISLRQTSETTLENTSQKKIYEVVIDNLIGFPDNIKVMPDGSLWIGIPLLRSYTLDLINHSPFIRKLLLKLRISAFNFAALGNKKYVGGLRVATNGEIIEYFLGKWDKIKFVTSINQRNNMIVLGSSRNNIIAIVRNADTLNDKTKQVQL